LTGWCSFGVPPDADETKAVAAISTAMVDTTAVFTKTSRSRKDKRRIQPSVE
jgi:hypothetical protein